MNGNPRFEIRNPRSGLRALSALAAVLSSCFPLAGQKPLRPHTFVLEVKILRALAAAGRRATTRSSPRHPPMVTAVENPAALVNFFRALDAVQSGRRLEPVRIMHFGDSHIAADILTGEIRRNFQRDFRIVGTAPEHRGQGVSYDALGVNGARVTTLISWHYRALADNLAERNPDLIIIAYGTNEVADQNWTIDSYHRLLIRIIRRLQRAAPGATILVYGPPERSDSELAARRMPLMLEAQRRAAFEAGAAFWNSYEAMGGSGAMNGWRARGWAQPDRVHLTRAGYCVMGRAFYADMIRAYNRFFGRG
jgi:lysophospholipase L1-like esterase